MNAEEIRKEADRFRFRDADNKEYLDEIAFGRSLLSRVTEERDLYKAALMDVALSNRTKISMREVARKVLFSTKELEN